MALNGQKDYFDNRVCVLSMQIAQLMLQIQFKCSYYFNMAANFKDGHHRLSCSISFALDGSGRSKKMIWGISDIFEHVDSSVGDANTI